MFIFCSFCPFPSWLFGFNLISSTWWNFSKDHCLFVLLPVRPALPLLPHCLFRQSNIYYMHFLLPVSILAHILCWRNSFIIYKRFSKQHSGHKTAKNCWQILKAISIQTLIIILILCLLFFFLFPFNFACFQILNVLKLSTINALSRIRQNILTFSLISNVESNKTILFEIGSETRNFPFHFKHQDRQRIYLEWIQSKKRERIRKEQFGLNLPPGSSRFSHSSSHCQNFFLSFFLGNLKNIYI